MQIIPPAAHDPTNPARPRPPMGPTSPSPEPPKISPAPSPFSVPSPITRRLLAAELGGAGRGGGRGGIGSRPSRSDGGEGAAGVGAVGRATGLMVSRPPSDWPPHPGRGVGGAGLLRSARTVWGFVKYCVLIISETKSVRVDLHNVLQTAYWAWQPAG